MTRPAGVRQTMAIEPWAKNFVHVTLVCPPSLASPHEPLLARCTSPAGQPRCSCGMFNLAWPKEDRR